jgi:hypothetical protein
MGNQTGARSAPSASRPDGFKEREWRLSQQLA